MIVFVYVASICVANLSVHLFGPAITPVNAFFLIGLDFAVRDKLHERFGVLKMLALIAAAGGLSAALNPATGVIALASVSAFAAASLTDTLVYQSMIKRPWLTKSNGSNLAASAVDSIVFSLMAFGSIMPFVVVGQFLAKVLGGAVWSWLLRGCK